MVPSAEQAWHLHDLLLCGQEGQSFSGCLHVTPMSSMVHLAIAPGVNSHFPRCEGETQPSVASFLISLTPNQGREKCDYLTSKMMGEAEHYL